MGIRIHKSIGYGTHTFRPSSQFLEKYHNTEPTVRDFIDWFNTNETEIRSLASDSFRHAMLRIDLEAALETSDKPLHSFVKYDDEAEASVILFLPVGSHYDSNWSRYDDDIDYAEESDAYRRANGDPRNRFRYLTKEIYPFNKGQPPLTIAALTLFYGIPEIWPTLCESLYVYWS